MSEEPRKEKRFWTFLTQSTHTIGSAGYITGWFVFGRVRQEDVMRQTSGTQETDLDLIYLTPMDEPITLDVSNFLEETTLDDLCPRMVMDALTSLFTMAEFSEIPKPPLDIKEGRVPPSMYKKMYDEQRKASVGVIRGSMRESTRD